MKAYRRGAHTVFEIHLHLVWTTKYRRPALTGEVALRVRDRIREVCGQHEVTLRKGHVAKAHLQLFVSIPPASDDPSADPGAEREDGLQAVGRVPPFAEAVLGAAPVGAGLLLL
jgi:hypothetical protein